MVLVSNLAGYNCVWTAKVLCMYYIYNLGRSSIDLRGYLCSNITINIVTAINIRSSMAKPRKPTLPLTSTNSDSDRIVTSKVWQLINALNLRPGSESLSTHPKSKNDETESTGLDATKGTRRRKSKAKSQVVKTESPAKVVESPNKRTKGSRGQIIKSLPIKSNRIGQQSQTTPLEPEQEKHEDSILTKHQSKKTPARTEVRRSQRSRTNHFKNVEQEEYPERVIGGRSRKMKFQNPGKVRAPLGEIGIRRTRQNTSLDGIIFDDSILNARTKRSKSHSTRKSQEIHEVVKEDLESHKFVKKSLASEKNSPGQNGPSGKKGGPSQTDPLIQKDIAVQRIITEVDKNESFEASFLRVKLPEVSSIISLNENAENLNIELAKLERTFVSLPRIPISLLVNEKDSIETTVENTGQLLVVEKEQVDVASLLTEKGTEVTAREIVNQEAPELKDGKEYEESNTKAPLRNKTSTPLQSNHGYNSDAFVNKRKKRFKRYEKSHRRVIINPSSESEASLSSLLESEADSQKVEFVGNGSVDYTNLERLMIEELVRDQTLLEAQRPIDIDDEEDDNQEVGADGTVDMEEKGKEVQREEGDCDGPEKKAVLLEAVLQEDESTKEKQVANESNENEDILPVDASTVEHIFIDKHHSKRRKINQKRKSTARKLFREQRNKQYGNEHGTPQPTPQPTDTAAPQPVSVKRFVPEDDEGPEKIELHALADKSEDSSAAAPEGTTLSVKSESIIQETQRASQEVTSNRNGDGRGPATKSPSYYLRSPPPEKILAEKSSTIQRTQIPNSSPPHMGGTFNADALRAAFGAPLATLTQYSSQAEPNFANPQVLRSSQGVNSSDHILIPNSSYSMSEKSQNLADTSGLAINSSLNSRSSFNKLTSTPLRKSRGTQTENRETFTLNALPISSKIYTPKVQKIKLIPLSKDDKPAPLQKLAEQIRERFQKAGNVYVGFVDEAYDSE